jgi:hypothetical protein
LGCGDDEDDNREGRWEKRYAMTMRARNLKEKVLLCAEGRQEEG